MKRIITTIFLLGFCLSNVIAQNYLRAAFPEWWNRNTTDPNWHYSWPEGVFEDLTVIASPQGIYTHVDVYATITHSDDVNYWDDLLEIVWQFDLPDKAIIFDSWLWVGNDIIKADVVDYWTALQTYNEIVDVQQDPSFLHQMENNRYEIRIYPLPLNDSRRIKMSFLIPTQWNQEFTTTSLVSQIFNSTSYLPETITVGMVQDPDWNSPSLILGNENIPLTETVVSGNGDIVLVKEIPATSFINNNFEAKLSTEAPLDENQSFLLTYEDQGDQFYQVAYVPDWDLDVPETVKHSLILIDYDDVETSVSMVEFQDAIIQKLDDYDTDHHYYNIAINGANEVIYLSEAWELYLSNEAPQMILEFINNEAGNDLLGLMESGFSWVNDLHPETDDIYIFSANDQYWEVENATFIADNLQNSIPDESSISIFNINDENYNSSTIEDNVVYFGNEYLFHLLASQHNHISSYNFRTAQGNYLEWLNPFLFNAEEEMGTITSNVSMPNGVAYEKYDIHDSNMTYNSNGVILQTGKYIGDFPLQVNAAIILPDGSFATSNAEIQPNQSIEPDSLMREMWYGPHLKAEEVFASTDNQIEAVVAQSINERVLTGFTAFLALEPSQGGEPCIGCFDFDVPTVTTEDIEVVNELSVTPNPATNFARIELTVKSMEEIANWQATIFDATGRQIAVLDQPTFTNNTLVWNWNIEENLSPGIYHCKVTNIDQSLSIKIVVIK